MNKSLLEEYRNFVQETFSFIEQNFENVIPAGRVDAGISLWTKDVYRKAEKLQTAEKREELETLVENYLKYSLEYFKHNTPWQNVEEDRRIWCNTMLNTVQLVVNLSVLMDAVGYEPAKKVLDIFGFESSLQINNIHSGYELPENTKINFDK